MDNYYSLYQGDAVGFMKSLDDDTADLIITDIPYESMEKHRKIGTTTRLKKSKSSSNEWFEVFPNSRFKEFTDECYRVLKKNRHCYLFSDSETMFVLKPQGEESGFKFWKPIVWDKMAIGTGYHYRAKYEFILFFEKGKLNLNSKSIPDILSVKRVWRGYPTEKPVDLMKILIEQSTTPGALVVDPFMGSGATGVAALECGRSFLGNDISTNATDVAAKRMEQLVNERIEINRCDDKE